MFDTTHEELRYVLDDYYGPFKTDEQKEYIIDCIKDNGLDIYNILKQLYE